MELCQCPVMLIQIIVEEMACNMMMVYKTIQIDFWHLDILNADCSNVKYILVNNIWRIHNNNIIYIAANIDVKISNHLHDMVNTMDNEITINAEVHATKYGHLIRGDILSDEYNFLIETTMMTNVNKNMIANGMR